MQVKTLNFDIKGDDRGSLIALEQYKEIPFDIKRVYYIFDTKEGVRRGYHAHKNLKQVAVCVKGSCKFLLDDGKSKEYVELNSPDIGLLIDKFVWREMYDFSPDCVLVVFADDYYDESDYIREYRQFIEIVRK